jgi:hypothetical protein
MSDFSNSAGYKTFMRGMIHLYKNIDQNFLKFNNNGVQGTIKKQDSPLTWEYRMCPSTPYYIGDLTPINTI